MQIFNSLEEWITFRKNIPSHLSLGFAPTMGNLHKGHLSLFARSKQENALTATSLFINPTQFNNSADFSLYPRTLNEDLKLLENSGVDYCLLPEKEAIYLDNYAFQLQEEVFSKVLEGAHRPGHFTGVLTIVMKLLNLVKPQIAYFGEKDFQQYKLIKDMVKAFFLEVEVVMCPTVREASGLAYSSRNNRLSVSGKRLAEQFAAVFHQDKAIDVLRMELNDLGIEVEYLELYDDRVFTAVIIDGVRLIDNK